VRGQDLGGFVTEVRESLNRMTLLPPSGVYLRFGAMLHDLLVFGILVSCVGDEALATSTRDTSRVAINQVHDVTVNADGTFTPNYLQVQAGDSIRWRGLGRTDAIARIGGKVPMNPQTACSGYRRAFDPNTPNEITGPIRRGISGIWALGPEGTSTSLVEIPSAEASAIVSGITAADGCEALTHTRDTANPNVDMKYEYTLATFNNGDIASNEDLVGDEYDGGGARHLLCAAKTKECNGVGSNCHVVAVDPAIPTTIPPGTYLHGLLSSTYENPDITGVVLRMNWNALQYDDNGTIRERWEHLDRELERAIAHGKLVTLDVRAGMYGTPDWIFEDYLRRRSEHAAPWCTTRNCSFTSAHPSAGRVEALEFVDYYGKVPPGTGCGNPIRIGNIGDVDYRNLYKDFIARFAAHVASDTRWFQVVAHVKTSGANLQTSEAELPHHCSDEHTNKAKHYEDPKASFASQYGDRVLDVFKTLDADGVTRTTAECKCNPKTWYDAGYTPQKLYDYYAFVEQQILTSFFGRKSLGYQLLQDGFPRVNAAGGSYFGDHLYSEDLVVSSVHVNPEEPTDVLVNRGYEDMTLCRPPTVDPNTGAFSLLDAGGTANYCSSDVVRTVFLPVVIDFNAKLAVKPVDDPNATVSSYALENTNGARYPRGAEQSENVLEQGATGRFGAPATAGYANPNTGRLFVPQHSGLQPLPQEQDALGYAVLPVPAEDDQGGCDQQRLGIGVLALNSDVVAAFPIAPGHDVSTLSEAKGCPNHWIVNEGKDTRTYTTPFPPVAYVTPPQLTGYQTSNKVRSVAHVESALFNLVYNTNAFFIELYEDAIWRISITRGAGDRARTLDDPVHPQRGIGCSLGFCYSKNLSRWAEELHWRRTQATANWRSYGGLEYPELDAPFPDTYTVNITDGASVIRYINPSRCQSALIDNSGDPNAPSALGVIEVVP
jgi:hypothetical protein